MELARILVDILLPVFLIVGTGAVAGRRLDIDARSLTKLVYWIIGPVFVFHVLASADLSADVVGRVLTASLIALGASGVIAFAVARISRRPATATAATITTAVYGNVGNFGLAIVAFTFGDGALGLAGILLVIVNVVGIVVGVAAARWHEHGATAAMRVAFTSPMTLAVVPAFVVNAGNASLPLWIERPVGLVAQALIPVMLITLGIQLGKMARPHIGADVVRSLSVKLIAAPIVAAAAAALVGLSGVPAGVVVLQFAMPPAVFTAVIALEHDLEPDLVTTTVLAGTLASLVTLPIVIAIVA